MAKAAIMMAVVLQTSLEEQAMVTACLSSSCGYPCTYQPATVAVLTSLVKVKARCRAVAVNAAEVVFTCKHLHSPGLRHTHFDLCAEDQLHDCFMIMIAT